MTEAIQRVSATIGRQRFLKEALLMVTAYFLYMFTRKLIFQDVEVIAFENAAKLISLESSLGLFREWQIQRWLLEKAKDAVLFFNWSYIITYWPIVIPSAIVIYKLDFKRYIYYRNVALLSYIIALLVFAIFPLAPPRMISYAGFTDTIQFLGPAEYNSRDTQVFYNAFAAMPSLHFGWTVLFGVIYFRTGITWLRVLGVLYPALTLFAIVITANHYFLDAVGGAGVIAIAFLMNAVLVRKGIPLHVKALYRPVRAVVSRRLSSG